MDDDFCAGDGKWSSVDVKISKWAYVYQQVWLASRRMEVIQGDVTLWQELVPIYVQEHGITERESKNEVFFPGLYCAFGGNAPIIVLWYALEIDMMFCEGMFQVFG